MNNKVNKIYFCNKNNIINKNSNRSTLLNNKIENNEMDIKNELTLFKNLLYNDLEKIHLKILNELKKSSWWYKNNLPKNESFR